MNGFQNTGVEIGISKYNLGIFATQLKTHFFAEGRAFAIDLQTRLRPTRKGQAWNIGMGNQGRAAGVAFAENNIADPFGETGLFKKLSEQKSGHRCQFRRLADHRITHRQSWCQFPRKQVEWQIPRCDKPNDPDGVTPSVVERLVILRCFVGKMFDR